MPQPRPPTSPAWTTISPPSSSRMTDWDRIVFHIYQLATYVAFTLGEDAVMLAFALSW